MFIALLSTALGFLTDMDMQEKSNEMRCVIFWVWLNKASRYSIMSCPPDLQIEQQSAHSDKYAAVGLGFYIQIWKR